MAGMIWVNNAFNRKYALCVVDFVIISPVYVCLSFYLQMCVCVCLFRRKQVISHSTLKNDTWLNASLPRSGSYIHN